jgi:hypothetical protein
VIASSIPGRIRLRHAALRRPERLERLALSLSDWPEALTLEPNARTGSLLLHYDPSRLTRAESERRCVAVLQALLPPPPSPEPAPVPALQPAAQGPTAPAAATTSAATARPSQRVRANRLAKRLMLASLLATLVLAAAGAKRWHTGAGLLFVHALGVHLWVHRRHLLR